MFDDDEVIPGDEVAPVAPPSSAPNPFGPAEIGCGLAILGFILGGASWMVLVSADPLGVYSIETPRDLDIAQHQAAHDRWQRSARVVLGSAATTLISLLVSATCGALAVGRWPASPLGALLRGVGVASALCLITEVGTRAIDRTLSTGESSDIRTPVAMVAFQALGLALAAPLAWAAIRPRPEASGATMSGVGGR